MKNLLFLLMFLPFAALADSPDFSVIAKALNSGDHETLAKYFDDNMEVTILEKEGVYSKAQSKQIIKQFFADNSPKSFKLVHQGTNNKNLYYCIGDLQTSNGKFRVCYYLRETNGSFVIQELGIERE